MHVGSDSSFHLDLVVYSNECGDHTMPRTSSHNDFHAYQVHYSRRISLAGYHCSPPFTADLLQACQQMSLSDKARTYQAKETCDVDAVGLYHLLACVWEDSLMMFSTIARIPLSCYVLGFRIDHYAGPTCVFYAKASDIGWFPMRRHEYGHTIVPLHYIFKTRKLMHQFGPHFLADETARCKVKCP